MSGARMHHQSSGLVQDQQVVVLEKNLQSDLLRQRFDFFDRRLCEFDGVAGANRIAGAGILAVEPDEAYPNKGLEASAGRDEMGFS